MDAAACPQVGFAIARAAVFRRTRTHCAVLRLVIDPYPLTVQPMAALVRKSAAMPEPHDRVGGVSSADVVTGLSPDSRWRRLTTLLIRVSEPQ
jgi:hypothetical protein